MGRDLDHFLKYLHDQVQNHSIYVWGAQGQDHRTISESWIKSRETSATNAKRAIAFWQKQVIAGYGRVLKAFDCSGLGMYFLRDITGLSSQDLSSNGMLRACEPISRQQLQRGDWVFRTYTSGSNKGRAYHIGYVVDDAMNVIEARGRDHGVIKAHVDSTPKYWNTFGRPSFFKDEITPAPSPEPSIPPPDDIGFPMCFTVSRALKVASPLMRGPDVYELQARLLALGYSIGSLGADGIYGKDTAAAVSAFQAALRLSVDGVAGANTITALGGLFQKN